MCGSEIGLTVQPAAFRALDAASQCARDFGVQAFAEILRRHSDAQSLCNLCRSRRHNRAPERRTRGVAWIMPGNHAQQRGSIAHIARERPDAIERRSKGDQSIARDTPIGGQNADHSAEACGLADRSAGIRAQRRDGHIRGNRRRRTAAGSARNALSIDRIAHRAIGRVLVRRTHRKLVAIEFAQQHGAGSLKPCYTAVASYGG